MDSSDQTVLESRTLVRQTIGLLKPTTGTITLGPFDLVADPDAARQLCSYLPQAQLPIDSFRVREAIELAGRIRGGRTREVSKRTDTLVEALDIGEWGDTLGKNLSGGLKRLVGFCMATVCPGRVVILDEPTNDVDPLRRRLLWEQVRELGTAGCAVLLVTHNVLEAEKSVDRLAVIDQGRVVADGTPASLKAADRSQLRLQVALAPGDHDTGPSALGRDGNSGWPQSRDNDRREGRRRRNRLGGVLGRCRRRRGIRARRDDVGGRLHPSHVPHVRRRRRGFPAAVTTIAPPSQCATWRGALVAATTSRCSGGT